MIGPFLSKISLRIGAVPWGGTDPIPREDSVTHRIIVMFSYGGVRFTLFYFVLRVQSEVFRQITPIICKCKDRVGISLISMMVRHFRWYAAYPYVRKCEDRLSYNMII